MIIDLIGDDNIVFSTDYPHGDSDFPEGVEEFLEMDGVSNESRKKILWDNCARLYGTWMRNDWSSWSDGVLGVRDHYSSIPIFQHTNLDSRKYP